MCVGCVCVCVCVICRLLPTQLWVRTDGVIERTSTADISWQGDNA